LKAGGTVLLAAIAAGACSRPAPPDPAVREEIGRREAFAHALLVDAGAEALRVSSTDDIRFEEGFTVIHLQPFERHDGHAFRWMGKKGHIRLRTQGDAPMRLHFVGWVNENIVHTKTRAMIYIDAQYVEQTDLADDKGFFFKYLTVEPKWFHGREWIDLTLELSSVGYHWLEPPELQVVHIFDFGWKRADAP
jgi:hypothetical protein